MTNTNLSEPTNQSIPSPQLHPAMPTMPTMPTMPPMPATTQPITNVPCTDNVMGVAPDVMAAVWRFVDSVPPAPKFHAWQRSVVPAPVPAPCPPNFTADQWAELQATFANWTATEDEKIAEAKRQVDRAAHDAAQLLRDQSWRLTPLGGAVTTSWPLRYPAPPIRPTYLGYHDLQFGRGWSEDDMLDRLPAPHARTPGRYRLDDWWIRRLGIKHVRDVDRQGPDVPDYRRWWAYRWHPDCIRQIERHYPELRARGAWADLEEVLLGAWRWRDTRLSPTLRRIADQVEGWLATDKPPEPPPGFLATQERFRHPPPFLPLGHEHLQRWHLSWGA